MCVKIRRKRQLLRLMRRLYTTWLYITRAVMGKIKLALLKFLPFLSIIREQFT